MKDLGSVLEYRRKGRIYYAIRLTLDGRRWSIYQHKGLKFLNRTHAEQVLAQIRGELLKAKHASAIAAFLPAAQKPNRVLGLMEGYLAELEAKVEVGDLSPHSVASFRRWVQSPKGNKRRRDGTDYYSWFAKVSIHELNARKVKAFKAWLYKQGAGKDTIRTVLERLKAFLVWCSEQEELLFERVPKIQLPDVTRARPGLLSDNQRRAVLEAIDWEWRGIFLLMSIGVRPGSARAVLVGDLEQGFIRIRQAVKSHNCDGPVGPAKAKKENWVPLTKDLAAWVNEFTRDRHPAARLFSNPRSSDPGRRWNHRALWLEWRAACGRAGVPYVPLYAGTKHSFATGRLLAGKSKDALGEFMQISRGMVDTYAQWGRELNVQVLDEKDLAEETKARVIELRGREGE